MNILEMAEQQIPHFANDIIEPITQEQIRSINEFSYSSYWCDNTSINVHDVCGTYHSDYAGIRWIDLLKKGKRMEENLRLLSENPQYYYNSKYKTQIEYIKIDDKIFIGKDGNHRTCIAKFLFFFEKLTTLHGVTVHEYLIDHAFKNAYESLQNLIISKKLPWNITVKRNGISRTDTAGWKRDTFELSVSVLHYHSRFEISLSTKQIMALIAESQNPFRTFTGKFKKLWRE